MHGLGRGGATCMRLLSLRRPFSTGVAESFGICIVPHSQAWIVERSGNFHKVLKPGRHFTIPFLDKITHVHSLKEKSIHVPALHLATKDNIPVTIGGYLHARVVDPMKASYQAEQPYEQLIECVGTQLRTALAKIDYDDLLANQQELNKQTQASLDPIAKGYGINVVRFSMRDIVVPYRISLAHTAQMEAEHDKHARIVKSESRTLEKLDDAKAAAEIEAITIAKRAKATAEGMEVMGFKPGQTESPTSSPISDAAHFLDEFSKQRTPLASESEDTPLNDDHFQPEPLPIPNHAHADDTFHPGPLPGADNGSSEEQFHPRPLPGAENGSSEDQFQPQPLPGEQTHRDNLLHHQPQPSTGAEPRSDSAPHANGTTDNPFGDKKKDVSFIDLVYALPQEMKKNLKKQQSR